MVDEKQSPTVEDQTSPNGYRREVDKSNNRNLSDIHNQLKEPIDHIDQANPVKIQCVAAANLELNEKYHNSMLQQAKQSFYCAIISASLGFLLFSGAVVFFMQHLTQLALIGTVGAAITAIVSGTTFYLYRYTLRYFDEIHKCLARTELILLGNSLCVQIHDEEKRTAAYIDLVRNVTQLTLLITGSEHKQNQQ